jgi:hypothetical protein
MIDASRSPQPAWRRYITFVALGAVLVLAAIFIMTKELHHHSSGSAQVNPPSASAPANPAGSSVAKAHATTTPGGIPVSGRNPFQG